MVNVSLKNIIGKNKEFTPLIQQLIEALGVQACITDETGRVLMGVPQAQVEQEFPLSLEGTLLGHLRGDKAASPVAGLLEQLILKESEKRRLGSEVLSLYHEINVIFNFSEKLSQNIEPEAIARITLDQAMQSIAADAGVVVLWDALDQTLQIPAHAGQPLFDLGRLRHSTNLLLKIGLSGQSEIFTDLSVLSQKGIIGPEVKSLMYAAMKVKHRIMGAVILVGTQEDQFSAAHLKLLVTLSLQSSAAIESAMLYEKNIREAREREEAMLRIHEVTQKFVPHAFIKSLGKETLTDVRLGDQVEKIVTVLFTDIRDYTTLAEKLTPEENFSFVSSFNARLGPIIQSNRGFVNQYLGDSIMAIFPHEPEDALRAAIYMQRAIRALNEERSDLGLPPISAGIGMHTGPLIMGITGDEFRMDAATISDTVNTAARIESLTKYYKSTLLLSEDTYKNIAQKQRFHTRNLGSVRLKGKHRSLNILECFDGFETSIFHRRVQNVDLFNQALSLYNQQRFDDAIHIFERMLVHDPRDLTTAFFLQKARKYQEEGVPEEWNGVHEMLNK